MRFARADVLLLAASLLSGSLGCSDDGPDGEPSPNDGGDTHNTSGAAGAGKCGGPGSGGSGARGGSAGVSGGPGEGGDAGSGAQGGESFGGAGEGGGPGEGGGAGSAESGPAEEPRECEYRYTEGHGDLFVLFDGELRLKVRSALVPKQAEILADPEDVCIIVGEASRALAESYGGAPAGEAFAFLGIPAGNSFWLLPESPQAGIPWFGASTEGVPQTLYANEELHVELAEVQAPEGGNVAVWGANFLGEPRPLLSTVEGQLVTRFSLGSHVHFNWSFSVAGEYQLGFRAEGMLSDGEVEQSSIARFRFLVGP